MLTTHPAMQTTFLTDSTGKVITWNDGCEKLFGLAAAQIVGKPMSTLLSGSAEQDDDWWRTLPRQSTDVVLDIHCAGGTMSSAHLTLAPQSDHGGAFHGWVAAFTTELDSNAPESVRVGRTPLGAIADMLPGAFFAINQDRRFMLWNRNLERVTELTAQELGAVNVLDMFEVVQRRTIEESIRQVFEEGTEVRLEVNYVSKSGREVPFLLSGTRIGCDGGFYLFAMGVDISDRHEQEKQLRLWERALRAASNGIVITRCEGRNSPIEYVNPGFERITGYTLDEVRGGDSRFMAAPGLDDNERAQVRQAVSERRAVNVVFRNMRKEGELFWNDLSITPVRDDNGVVTHFIGVIVDVTAAKERAAYLEHEVNHDALTGLANRNLMWDRLEHAIHFAQRNKSLVAIVLIDLNNFKTINDTFGHEAGDVVLQVVAKKLLAAVRDTDTVARLSGDEFVVILDNQPSVGDILRRVENLRQKFSGPVSFENKGIPVGASIGVSVYPHDGRRAFDLVRAADVAMYSAKTSRTSHVQFFSDDMKSTADAKKRLESSMREALDREEWCLVYQPRVRVDSGKISGLEALVRWRHPEHGLLLPLSFLPEAEENGVIVQIGERVFEQVCAFVQELRRRGYTDLPVAVNVSKKEYRQQHFVSEMAARLTRYGIPPASLEIDVREQDVARNPDLIRNVAAQMRELGLPLSVDEFGQGMFDLTLLQQLSLKHLKIAKAAVHAISFDDRRGAMAKSLIDIGRNLDLHVIGEAVETREQMDFLTSHGCDELQGIYISEPLTADAVYEMLRTRQAV